MCRWNSAVWISVKKEFNDLFSGGYYEENTTV